MNTEELTETVNALANLVLVQAGQASAFGAVIDALIATLGTSFPPLVAPLLQHLEVLAEMRRENLAEESFEGFDSIIEDIQGNLRILQKNA